MFRIEITSLDEFAAFATLLRGHDLDANSLAVRELMARIAASSANLQQAQTEDAAALAPTRSGRPTTFLNQ